MELVGGDPHLWVWGGGGWGACQRQVAFRGVGCVGVHASDKWPLEVL